MACPLDRLPRQTFAHGPAAPPQWDIERAVRLAYIDRMATTESSNVLAGVARDDEGYLLDPDDWSRELARAIACEVGQTLGDEHWQVIAYIREAWARTQSVPEARRLLRFMRDSFGDERGTRRYLYRLFPTGYAQSACKIAGMRKPLKLMLDV